MRRLLLVLLLVPLTMGLGAQSIDLIVMVDTSESMFRVFPELVDYLLRDLLTERLRFGDTFHLLTFADTPEVEIALPIDSEQSVEQVLRRLLLLRALGGYTDLVAALRFLAGYARELPEGNRKTILLLTDGIHDPPPDSSFRMDPEEVRRALFETAQEIARSGWNVSILRLPADGGAPVLAAGGPGGTEATGGQAATSTATPTTGPAATAESGDRTAPVGERGSDGASSGAPATDYVDEIARALRAPVADLRQTGANGDLPSSVGFPTLQFPRGVIRGGKRLPVSFVIHSSSPEAIYVELESVRLEDGTELLSEPATAIVPPGASRTVRATIVLPDGTPPGRQTLAVELSFAGGLRVSPTRGVLEIENNGRPGLVSGALSRSRAGGGTLLLVLLILGGVGLVTLIAMGVRSRVDIGSWARGLGYSEGRYTRERGRGHPLIEMVVTMQNHNIGHRNVHSIQPGGSRTVGGGRSAYLIYFVPVPPDMGYLTYDGRVYTFVPTRPELFAELGGQVSDCIGKEIPARSPKGYRFTIVFRPFRSPLDEINDLMRSIRVRPPDSGDGGKVDG